MRRIIFIGLLIAVLLGGFVAYKMYNKPHADMSSIKVDIKLSAAELFSVYEADEVNADGNFLGKILQISGEIINVNKENGRVESLTLETGDVMTGVTCLLDEVDTNHRQDFKIGEKVTMNCVCTGKLMDIELNRCVEIK